MKKIEWMLRRSLSRRDKGGKIRTRIACAIGVRGVSGRRTLRRLSVWRTDVRKAPANRIWTCNCLACPPTR